MKSVIGSLRNGQNASEREVSWKIADSGEVVPKGLFGDSELTDISMSLTSVRLTFVRKANPILESEQGGTVILEASDVSYIWMESNFIQNVVDRILIHESSSSDFLVLKQRLVAQNKIEFSFAVGTKLIVVKPVAGIEMQLFASAVKIVSETEHDYGDVVDGAH